MNTSFRWIAALILLFVSVCWMQASPSVTTSVSPQLATLFSEGEMAVYTGEYPTALDRFDQILAVLPEGGSFRDPSGVTVTPGLVWAYKGDAYAGLGKNTEALDAYDRSLKEDPDNSAVWQQKAQLLQIMNRTAEADAAETQMRRAAQKELDDFDKAAFSNPTTTKSPLLPAPVVLSIIIAGFCMVIRARKTG